MEAGESCKLITDEQPGYPAICKKLSYAILAIDRIYIGYRFKVIGIQYAYIVVINMKRSFPPGIAIAALLILISLILHQVIS